jgi:prepilin-type N-terminal cleavage/methylation domain-containing protein
MHSRGFTLVELLVAMAVTLLLAGALIGAVGPAREAFARVPAELDLQQSARTALDQIAQAIRSAGGRVAVSEPDESGTSLELTAIVPVAGGAQGVLEVDQGAPDGAITLAASPCPTVREVCGFRAGSIAMAADDDGGTDVFAISSINRGARRLHPAAPLSRSYAAGAVVREVDRFTFRLDEQDDESYSLVRVTAAGAVQPIVDRVEDIAFRMDGVQVVIGIGIGGRVFTTSAAWRHGS